MVCTTFTLYEVIVEVISFGKICCSYCGVENVINNVYCKTLVNYFADSISSAVENDVNNVYCKNW
jgi:hypothetical protein